MFKFNHIHETNFQSVDEMLDFASTKLITRNYDYGFRGHSDSSWDLEPTLMRFIDRLESSYGANKHRREELTELTIKRLHSTFKNNLIINNDLSQDKVESIDLWQYGQHYDLPSPLLDWTHSPYIALFFALESPIHIQNNSSCIWSINKEMIHHLNREITNVIRPKWKDRISQQTIPSIGNNIGYKPRE